MIKYKKLEGDIINVLLAGNNPVLNVLRKQYEKSEILSVDETGCGVFFNYSMCDESVEKFENDFQLGDVLINLPESPLPIGSILFVKNGYIETLELHTYDDEWPEKIDEYVLTYDSEVRDLPIIRTIS